ncbi:MAG: putative transport permease [Ilumatobacteraceae bacterium]|jgi:osmoprotectant transport system permease protein|nr:putative transport permease [Ilumatobacteraceae bacterium]
MSVLVEGVQWLFDSGNWWGNRGIVARVVEHLEYSGAALGVAFVIAFPIGLIIGHTGKGRFVASSTANVLRAVPTYGVVSLLFIWRPLTLWPLLLALAILALPPIMLNTAAGIANVDPQTRDAAEGVGLTGFQVLTKVEAPCALPLILAGMRSAANQVIATATVLGVKGQGGLGVFIFSGYGTQRYYIVYGASIAIIAIVLLVEAAFAVLQRRLVSPGLRVARIGKQLRSRKSITLVGNSAR